ncbi:hypothetical protein KVV02_002072 [Mortierella alpina]|uniref:Transmembrane protein n=1 Tax=Mortierella alpina TaxID=64518 RepID=A0A9P8CZA2_MORAP|nr:hypothetical protein KVV02_002072 [Mortierella alpina]
MGGNTFNCLTTDSGATTFYGMIFADDYAISKYRTHQNRVVAVVKSNTNPSSPLSMTWSVVSKIGFESLTGQVTQAQPPEMAKCAISSKGVFSLLVHFGYNSAGSPGPEGPRVYQYDPNGKTMDASFNYRGAGSWSNVTVDPTDPAITGPYWFSPQLQYVYNGQMETLVLSFLGDKYNVELFVLKEVTNTLAHAATWKMWYLEDRDWDSVLISQTHYVGGAATLGRAVNVSQKFDSYQNFVPVNGQFALMKRDKQMDAITLSGPSMGNFYSNISINISDSIDPNFKFEAAQSSGESKIGLIVGVTVAVVVLVGAGIGYFFWRKRSNNRAAGVTGDATAAPALPPKDRSYTQSHSFVQKIEPGTHAFHGGRPMAYGQTTGFTGATTAPGFTGATTAPPTTVTTMMPGTQVQTFQEHMQGLQLSNHPRPNVVTTGATPDVGGFSGTTPTSQAPVQPTP